MKPSAVAEIQRSICARNHCEHLDALNFHDPCASCPNGHWGVYSLSLCRQGATPPPNVARTTSQPERRPTQPGDLLASLIYQITRVRYAKCHPCAKRAEQMNAWGWWGCWRNRKIIIGWLAEEAAKRGHKIPDSQLLNLLKAAIKETRQRPS